MSDAHIFLFLNFSLAHSHMDSRFKTTPKLLTCYFPEQTMDPKNLHKKVIPSLASKPFCLPVSNISIIESNNSPFQTFNLIKLDYYYSLNTPCFPAMVYSCFFSFDYFFHSLSPY